ncbi:MAG: Mut7-C RNAse domain-containing protein [Bacillota bacterium]
MLNEKIAYFRFFAELNDFFPEEKDGIVHQHKFKGIQSVKDRIESMGVPHTEIYLITSNNEPVDFSYHVQNGDFINVYPVFKNIKICSDISLREPYSGEYRFVLDTHLGKLARYLRMLGFDSLYDNKYKDKELANISKNTDRILLTRDIGLLKRSKVKYAYFIRYDDPRNQLKSLINRYSLSDHIKSFGRCVECNGELHSVNKNEIIHLLEPKTKKYYNEFYRCSKCRKIYWPGSHYQNMKNFINELINNNSKSGR